MLLPDALLALIDEGVVQQVLRPLKSGKEASLYVVLAEDRICAAKVYKQATQRNFHNRADYTEGRAVRDSRLQRSMERGSTFGRAQREEAWQQSESDALRRLAAFGVRVPQVHQRADGVLLMDLVTDRDGEPAPQLASMRFTRDEAYDAHREVMHQIAHMLLAGLVHGDLSEYNILGGAAGLTIIDLPQAVDAARNTSAKRLLMRDVGNLTRFFARFDPNIRRSEFGEEIWLLHEQGALSKDSKLTGRLQAARSLADEAIIAREVAAAKADAVKRAEIAAAREAKRLAREAANPTPVAPVAPREAEPVKPAAVTMPAPSASRYHQGGSRQPQGDRQETGRSPYAAPQQDRRSVPRGPFPGSTRTSPEPRREGFRQPLDARPAAGPFRPERRQDPRPPRREGQPRDDRGRDHVPAPRPSPPRPD
jgi:RIO kinase 1